jgi:predicted ATPase
MPISDGLAGTDQPVEVTSFIGRQREMSDVRRLLRKTRLLTLTGAGGVGKTRLALRMAQSLGGCFPSGVEFVELATLEDADLLEPTVAAALGLPDSGRHSTPVLVDHLADKRMLLVLDNCEHLLQACGDLVDRLLRGAPRLQILITSRHTLGVTGEQVLPVPPLPVPTADATVRGIARCEAVRLFTERAAGVRRGFAVDAVNAPAVARLSQRLDGIPLAIELAAVRLRTTPVEELVRQLDDRFDVLTGGSSTALPRHQTLRATMEWSFGLCSPDEQLLWSRLSMFPGGVDLETVEAICSGDGIAREDMFDLVAGLVDKSVLAGERRDTGVRYRMLESIRAYGRERLAAADEQALRRRYTDHYRQLTERNRLDHLVSDQLERFRMMHLELPNVRHALDLCFSPGGDGSAGLEIASALWTYWILAGALTEGRHWLERGLEFMPEPGTARVRALCADALLAIYQGDGAAATPLLKECRTLARRTGDESAIAFAIQTSGVAALSAGDPRGFVLLEDALARHRAIGDIHAVGVNLYHTAAFGAAEDPDRATALGTELLELSEARDASLFQAYAMLALGSAAWKQGDWRRTEAMIRKALMITGVVNDRWGLTQCLEILAWTAGARGQHERAARLLGAAHELWQALESSPTGLRHQLHSHKRCEAQARQALETRVFNAAFRDGRQLRLDPAVAYALEDDGP